MTCCVIALALVYQLIAAVRRVRGWCGVGRAAVQSAGRGRLQRRAAGLLRRPWVRVALLGVLAIEGAAAGTLAYQHRFHLHNEFAAIAFAATGYAQALCGID
ncbi:MAG: hypothetical protein RLW62_01090 [Gammaproteobacteria bacterium]